jgi:hypothetical protein
VDNLNCEGGLSGRENEDGTGANRGYRYLVEAIDDPHSRRMRQNGVRTVYQINKYKYSLSLLSLAF